MPRTPLCVALSLLVAACAQAPRTHVAAINNADGARADLVLLETTDLHANVLSHDYFKGAADPTIGFERVATLIRAARKEFGNTLLFDDGDTIQGTSLADYQALANRLHCTEKLAIYKAMDALGYDGGTIGNHEFNYGLDFLSQVTGHPLNVDGVSATACQGPAYPLVLSNVFSARDGAPLYAPYAVIEKSITAYSPDGSALQLPLRVGILGFTPPPILRWDKRNLEGKVSVLGVVEAARRYLPELQSKGVDVVVAISHGGLNTEAYTTDMENANWHLAGVAGIDAILMGHSHDVFPHASDPKSRFNTMQEVDNERGLVRGVPAVMGGYWGKDLGLIKLALMRKDGRWQVQRDASRSEVRAICTSGKDCVAADPEIAGIVAAEHAATVAWVDTPIGRSTVRLSTYFANVGNSTALGAINAAQRDYTQRWLREERPDLARIPVLSAAAPFKAGFAGPEDYTDVPAGPLTVRNAADLYLYPNTIAAVQINGATLKVWLEKSAELFNRIDPAASAEQELINTHVPTYTFDLIQGGVSYVIDVSQPVGARISDLRYRGKRVAAAQDFIVATNNYRASGTGGIAGLDGSNIVMSAERTNRDVVIDWMRAHPALSRSDIEARPWRFARLRTQGPVVFRGRAGMIDIARAEKIGDIRQDRDNGDGTATYRIALDH
ncbi:MAG: bifunctional 2',3'-cyclic-nucleotide 2'-phosphodiesterase/3'-nucleotidase [Tahibacter sp.]